MINYKTVKVNQDNFESFLQIYHDANWSNYLKNEDTLFNGLRASLLILGAFEDDNLVGFIRIIGDGFTIIYIQDIIVLRRYQRKQIGSQLMKIVLKKYKAVRQKVLLTDNNAKQIQFYESLGFQKTVVNNLVCFTYFD